MQKKCKKIWSCQKKAVLLHPLFEKTIIRMVSSECKPSKRGAIAQLVEQRTENPCVTGSIPVGTTNAEKRLSQSWKSFLLSKDSVYSYQIAYF